MGFLNFQVWFNFITQLNHSAELQAGLPDLQGTLIMLSLHRDISLLIIIPQANWFAGPS